MTLQEVRRGNVPTSHVVPHQECVSMWALLQSWMKILVAFVLAKHIVSKIPYYQSVYYWPTLLLPVALTCGKEPSV